MKPNNSCIVGSSCEYDIAKKKSQGWSGKGSAEQAWQQLDRGWMVGCFLAWGVGYEKPHDIDLMSLK